MKSEFSPIILFVYNRPWHTKQTLEALKANYLAEGSRLYIYSDGAKPNSSVQQLEKVKEVRKLIRAEQWCGEVVIKEQPNNLGLAESIIQGVTEVIEEHGKVIVLEDDLITGKYFLNFMNKSLAVYKDEKKIFGISGYKYPSIRDIEESTFFLPIASSWGFGTWKDRWNKVNFNGKDLLKKIDEHSLENKLNFGGNPFYEMLKDQVENKNDSWAIRFYVSMFLERTYFLYPNKTFVRNIGFDNSGVHCGTDDFFQEGNPVNCIVEVQKKRVKLRPEIVDNVRKKFEAKFQKTVSNRSRIGIYINKWFKKLQ